MSQTLPPMLGFEAATSRLAAISITPHLNLKDALKQLTGIAASVMKVGRVSVWRLVVDGRLLLCEYLHQEGQDGIYEGSILYQKDFPNYFKALDMHEVIPIDDIDGEPLTEEFREPYFKPLNITSMLDAPIYTNGLTCGVVCHESIGEKRSWTEEECAFAATVSLHISRLHAEWMNLKYQHFGLDPHRTEELERMVTFGRLSAGMAHDFKNVLSVIVGYVELIEAVCSTDASALAAKIQDFTGDILRVVEQGDSLAQELMSLGHESPSHPAVLDLRKFLEEHRGILKMPAGPDVQVAFELSHSVSRIFFDPRNLERLLLNLVINAVDAMPSGGALTLRLHEDICERGYGDTERFVVLEIADTGMGMSPEIQKKIFEPFFTTKGAKGTGLGLAVVKQIMSSSGGLMKLDSAPGQGTRISLCFPIIGRPD